MNKADHELITDCLQGQTEAFSQLVVRYQNRLFNTLISVVGSTEDARDVAQDAFVHAFQKLQSFRGQASFYSWLFRIALNSAVSMRRKEKHRVTVSIDAAREQSGLEPAEQHPAAQPEFAMETSERQTLVRKALAELPEDYRIVLVLKEIDGLKYEEISEIVECPIGTVRSRIHRGRIELRDRLKVLLKEFSH